MTWKDGASIVEFATPHEFEEWLEKHHQTVTAVWVKFYKKASGKILITYGEALDEALCFGWIDGVVNKFDDESYLQRFTPRRKGSNWSKRNTEHIERLIKLGKIRPAGLAEVEAAKKDGRWEKAYDTSASITIPEDFLRELEKNTKAKTFFDSLNRVNFYAIAYRLQTAKKPATYERTKKQILEILERGEKFH